MNTRRELLELAKGDAEFIIRLIDNDELDRAARYAKLLYETIDALADDDWKLAVIPSSRVTPIQ